MNSSNNGPATTAYHKLVEGYEAQGKTREQAVRAVATNHSQAREAYVAEVNQAAAAKRADAMAPKPVSGGRATNIYFARLETLMESGLSRSEAVRKIAVDHTAILEAYVQEHNQAARTR